MLEPYPFPYGFILGTRGEDGDGIDCFVITENELHSGDIVECRAIGILEFSEGGETDLKAIVKPEDEIVEFGSVELDRIRAFITVIFSRFPEIRIGFGRFVGRREAEAMLEKCKDDGAVQLN